MVSTRLSKESPVLLSVRECLWQKLGLSWIASFSRKKSGLGVGGDKRNQEESCGPPAETGEEKPLRFQRNAWEALSHVDKSHTDTLINHTLLLVWGEVPHFCAPLVKIPLLLCYSSIGTVVRGIGVGQCSAGGWHQREQQWRAGVREAWADLWFPSGRCLIQAWADTLHSLGPSLGLWSKCLPFPVFLSS